MHGSIFSMLSLWHCVATQAVTLRNGGAASRSLRCTPLDLGRLAGMDCPLITSLSGNSRWRCRDTTYLPESKKALSITHLFSELDGGKVYTLEIMLTSWIGFLKLERRVSYCADRFVRARVLGGDSGLLWFIVHLVSRPQMQ